MIEVINNLKKKEIIYQKSVDLLKQYIEKKYPDSTSAYRVRVFADAVHKIINDHIREFRRGDQKRIKEALFSEVSEKAVFSICAYDIMKTCVGLDIDEDTFIEHLTSWINHQQPVPVNQDTLLQITQVIKEELLLEINTEEVDEESHALLEQLEAAFTANATHLDSDYLLLDPKSLDERFFDINYKDLNSQTTDRSASFEVKDITMTEENLQVDESTLEKEVKDPRPIIVVERERTIEPLILRSVQNELEEEQTWIMRLKSYINFGSYRRDLKQFVIVIVGALVLLVVALALIGKLSRTEDNIMVQNDLYMTWPVVNTEQMEEIAHPESEDIFIDASHLDTSIQYKEIDKTALKAWLEARNAKISEDIYLENLIDVSKLYGVNPLLLVAITGQEQNFVQKDHDFAELMINNPYNIYRSWQLYNTDFDEATRIASRTILTLSEDRPLGEDPVKWINRKYAEDSNWHLGVNAFLNELEAVAGQ
ncbi:conserved protein of unknown function [Petrocella atlantisensis]|uniref:Uncharacterized protein n=1 Tax=Petrocella atlantisensis TaxID=2173034 RepID=A0A3P7PGX3_9FIRM|nr:hypothetical protein [Petrocella atlantisensis]VDN48128.1 conserved protein of unknown function [Petrocella atlantisensis]